MNAIVNCKLYRSSRRKQKILAALSDVINQELVSQLKQYLDDNTSDTKESEELTENTNNKDEETPEVAEKTVSESSDNTATSSATASNFDPNVPLRDVAISKTVHDDADDKPPESDISSESTAESNNSDNSNTLKSSGFHSAKKKSDESEKDDNPVHSESETKSEDKPSEDSSVDSSTRLNTSQKIQSSCCTMMKDLVDAEAIRGTLNAREDTKGVSRIFVKEKENELWIYYQDKVNLNSVMEPVIYVLNAVGDTNLEFNRLARTENAIVFEIASTFNPVEPFTEEVSK